MAQNPLSISFSIGPVATVGHFGAVPHQISVVPPQMHLDQHFFIVWQQQQYCMYIHLYHALDTLHSNSRLWQFLLLPLISMVLTSDLLSIKLYGSNAIYTSLLFNYS